MSRLRIAVLLSGTGTGLENVFEHIESDRLDAEVVLVIASRASAAGLERARRRGVPAVAVPRRDFPDVTRFNDEIHALLESHDVEVVALLGFLSPFQTRGRWNGRTINVHPARIPAFSGAGFYGRRVHEAVLDAGVRLTGATVHFVDDEYDHGPIISQETVPVLEDDTPETLAARVQAVERRLVPEVLQLLAEGRISVAAGRVHIKRD